jgi:hypothetical protein
MIRVRPLLLSLTLLAVLPPGVAAQIAATGSPHGPSPEGSSCTLCHTATDWKARPKSMAFDHSQQTEFELSGRHGELDCRQCHLDLRWSEPKIAANECASCHFDVHRGNLSANCRSCHTTESFAEVPGVAVHAQTTFPLTGAHLQVTCETCHTESQAGAFFGTLDSECIACHEEDYATTQLVDHVATGFPTDCQQCHETLTWTGGTVFDHVSISNGYLLVGAHDGMRERLLRVSPTRLQQRARTGWLPNHMPRLSHPADMGWGRLPPRFRRYRLRPRWSACLAPVCELPHPAGQRTQVQHHGPK